jgi:hypothetical protein
VVVRYPHPFPQRLKTPARDCRERLEKHLLEPAKEIITDLHTLSQIPENLFQNRTPLSTPLAKSPQKPISAPKMTLEIDHSLPSMNLGRSVGRLHDPAPQKKCLFREFFLVQIHV